MSIFHVDLVTTIFWITFKEKNDLLGLDTTGKPMGYHLYVGLPVCLP
jgi:hypothetical protein